MHIDCVGWTLYSYPHTSPPPCACIGAHPRPSFRYAPMSLKCSWGLDHFGLLDWPLHTQVPNQMHMQQTQQQLQPIPMQPMQQLPVPQQPPHLQQASLPGPLPAASVQRLPVHIDRSNTRPFQAAWFRSRCSRRSRSSSCRLRWSTCRCLRLRVRLGSDPRHGPQAASPAHLLLVPRLFSECNCSWLIHGMQYLVCACLSDSRTFSLAMLNKACDISVVSCVNTHRTPT
jgi:hypothetical protein